VRWREPYLLLTLSLGFQPLIGDVSARVRLKLTSTSSATFLINSSTSRACSPQSTIICRTSQIERVVAALTLLYSGSLQYSLASQVPSHYPWTISNVPSEDVDVPHAKLERASLNINMDGKPTNPTVDIWRFLDIHTHSGPWNCIAISFY